MFPEYAQIAWIFLGYQLAGWVVIIVEEAEAVEAIDEIAAVPGIDAIFIGVNDLSHSYGFRGRQEKSGHKKVISIDAGELDHPPYRS